MPPKKYKFKKELKREFTYLKDTGNGNLLCNCCGSVFSITHDGSADVNSHLGNVKRGEYEQFLLSFARQF